METYSGASTELPKSCFIVFIMLHWTRFWLIGNLVAVASALPSSSRDYHTSPIVHVINGTYQGVHEFQFNQDFFLGIPFAQSPTGDLRFRNPKSLNSTWNEKRLAVSYSPECVGYGVSSHKTSR